MSDLKTTRRLRVYGGNLVGEFRAIMACKSFAEFTRATRITREYGCETGNAEEIAKAMSEPGKLFVRSYRANFTNGPWAERERDDA